MAISPLGNIVYINQNMNVAASKVTNQLNRYDLQNFMTAEMVNEKEKIVTEVRPPEESHAIDPDRDKNQPQEEDNAETQEQEDQEKGPHSDTPNLHILDVKV